jgi:hypothetical protein
LARFDLACLTSLTLFILVFGAQQQSVAPKPARENLLFASVAIDVAAARYSLPLARTAHEIRDSLLATSTITLFRGARTATSRAH